MTQSSFGSGFLFGVTAAGAAIMFAALQDVSVDFSGDLKLLYGQGQYPLEQARGKSKIDAKATMGRIDPVLFNQLYFGAAQSAGQILSAFGETGTVPASSTYTITAANGATFSADLGVLNATTGLWMTKVSSGPTTGQYSVNLTTGVYTFAVADASVPVKLYYTYTSAGTGITITGANPVMGSVPYFKAVFNNTFNGKQSTLTLFKCASSKLSLPAKQDDFTLPDLSFSAQDDGFGNVFQYSANG